MTDDPTIQALNQKMDTILKVLQEFGLNFIQNIGNLKHSISILTTHMENFNESIIYLKGLGIKLEELGRIKQDISSELKYIESLIKTNQKPISKENNILVPEENNNTLKSIEILNRFRENLTKYTDIKNLCNDLEVIKEDIFKITGGHRVLFEINNAIKELKKEMQISEDIIKYLDEKTSFWVNKLNN